MKFSKGDVVVLKSGGPKMTIFDVDGDSHTCRWFNTSGAWKRENFSDSELVPETDVGETKFAISADDRGLL